MRGQELLHKLEAEGVKPTSYKKAQGPLSGQGFVITGTLTAFSREVAGEKIEALGGTLQDAVTKDTAYLVVGEAPGASKITKAEKLGTQRLDEAGLLKLLS